MAQLPPSFIDFALSRGLADGILLTGCSGGDCRYRLGAQWTEQRLQRKRDPMLRERVDSRRIAMGWQQPWVDSPHSMATLHKFQSQLSELSEDRCTDGSMLQQGRFARNLAMGIAFGLFALVTGYLSVWPVYHQIEADTAMVSLSFSHAGQRVQECRNLSPEELHKLPPNMRQAQDCPRERLPIEILFEVDGRTRYHEILQPSGIWKDGEAVVYQRLPVTTGQRLLRMRMRDSDRRQGFDFSSERRLELQEFEHLVIEFDLEQKTFVFR